MYDVRLLAKVEMSGEGSSIACTLYDIRPLVDYVLSYHVYV